MSPDQRDHVRETIDTYNRIAPDYILTATPEMRAWEENSMRRFRSLLSGKKVLVPGCGDGRDSRFLSSLGLEVYSFDLSDSMLKIAKTRDPLGEYFPMDLRGIDKCPGPYDGIFASGCLYHLAKPELVHCVSCCHELLSPSGIFYLNMKEGTGERFEDKPRPTYPGGEEARKRLQGKRFYAYYEYDELLAILREFEILHEQKLLLGDGAFEFWLQRGRTKVVSESSANG